MSDPKDCATTTQDIAAQALLDEKHDGSAACSPSPMINPLDINSSEPWNVARSSSNSPSFENRVTDVSDVADIGVEDRHPHIRKRKRVHSPANNLGLKRPRLRFIDTESAAAMRKAVAKVRQNSACIRCRILKKQGDGNLPCDSCISSENSKCLLGQPSIRDTCSDLDLFGIGYEVIFQSPLPDNMLDTTDEHAVSSGFSKNDLDELDLTLLSLFDPADLFRVHWQDIGELSALSYIPANFLPPLPKRFREVNGLPLAGLGIELARSTVLAYNYTVEITRLRKAGAGQVVEPAEEVAQLLCAASRARHGRKMIDILQLKVEDFRSCRLSLPEGMVLARCILTIMEIVSGIGEDFNGIILFPSCFHIKKLLPQKIAAGSQLTRILSGWLSDLSQRLVPALQERWKHVKELRAQIMEKRRGLLGEEHPDTLLSMNDLALTFICQKRWKEVEQLLVPAMKTSRNVLSKEHSTTLVITSNLAVAYYYQGQWKEAEKLFVHVLKTRREVLGEEHPDTLMSMNNLATMFMHQYRWKEARAVEGGRKTTCTSDGDKEKSSVRGKFGLTSGTGVILVRLELPDAIFVGAMGSSHRL